MESLPIKDRIVLPGDYIGQDLMVGHGTYSIGSELFSCVAGVVHQINNVIYVKSLKQHFRAEIGDVLVGRVALVDQKRWLVDVNSYQHGVLNLTSTMLPGGEQRRKSQEDQIQMRTFLKEGDIVCTEVQGIGSMDGKISLQTRGIKYSKIMNGFLLQVDHNFIRRVKSHIVEFFSDSADPVGAIIGANGNIWIFKEDQKQKDEDLPQLLSISKGARDNMALLRNSIVALEKAQLPIYKETILKVIEQCQKQGVERKERVNSWQKVTTLARQMIEKDTKMNQANFKQMMGLSEQQDFIMND